MKNRELYNDAKDYRSAKFSKYSEVAFAGTPVFYVACFMENMPLRPDGTLDINRINDTLDLLIKHGADANLGHEAVGGSTGLDSLLDSCIGISAKHLEQMKDIIKHVVNKHRAKSHDHVLSTPKIRDWVNDEGKTTDKEIFHLLQGRSFGADEKAA